MNISKLGMSCCYEEDHTESHHSPKLGKTKTERTKKSYHLPMKQQCHCLVPCLCLRVCAVVSMMNN